MSFGPVGEEIMDDFREQDEPMPTAIVVMARFGWLLWILITVAIAACFTLLVVATAHAEDVIGIHTVSTHFRSGPNNANFGAYIRRSGWEVGAFDNSSRKLTTYGGYQFEASSLPLKPALLLGLATGYRRTITPAIVASVSHAISDRDRVRLSFTRDATSAVSRSVLHLQFERKWP